VLKVVVVVFDVIVERCSIVLLVVLKVVVVDFEVS
jgi:hypothetical protein|tara:strand:- start:1047 stop:1151 length:105 start_codon:yes stop_codon:yes gene_type:complete